MSRLWASPAFTTCTYAHMTPVTPVTPKLKRGSIESLPSPAKPALKPSYSAVAKLLPKSHSWARDPGKVSRDPSRDQSRDPLGPEQSRDQLRNTSRDISRDYITNTPHARSCVRARDPPGARFGRATRPLIHTWKTVGTVNRSTELRRTPGIFQGIPQGIPQSLQIRIGDSPGNSPRSNQQDSAVTVAQLLQTPPYS